MIHILFRDHIRTHSPIKSITFKIHCFDLIESWSPAHESNIYISCGKIPNVDILNWVITRNSDNIFNFDDYHTIDITDNTYIQLTLLIILLIIIIKTK